MQKEEKQVVHSKLVEKLSRIADEIKELKELTAPIAPDCAIGRISRMDAINNKSVNEAALRQKEEQQKQLKYALSQIDNNKFGQCVVCGTEIPIGRILLIPESNKCVRCASR